MVCAYSFSKNLLFLAFIALRLSFTWLVAKPSGGDWDLCRLLIDWTLVDLPDLYILFSGLDVLVLI